MNIPKDDLNNSTVKELGEREIDLRKRWLEFNPEDEAIIERDIDRIVGGNIDELIESMYAHFLSFEETRSFFPNDHVLKHAQHAQKAYFKRFTKGNYNREYVADRLGVGSTHHRIDLDPKWYIGAYNRVLSWFLPQIVEHTDRADGKLTKALSALMKLIFFDMGLAIECYISAKENSIRRHRDSIRELEMERRVTASIVENAPLGIVSMSDDFICLECNDEFVSIVDKATRADVMGQSLFQIAPGLKKSDFEDVLKSGQSCRRTTELLNLPTSGVSDSTYWDWAIWPIKDESGKCTGLVAMFANATDRVLLHQQREDFVATLTHDLKTPVLATNRAVGYLLDGDFGPVSDPQREILNTILQSNSALYGLVQTLLDVYRFDSGVKEFSMKSCNLAAIITQMVTEIMPLAQDKGVTLQARLLADSLEVICDEDEIRRVIQNLIDNSLKFTPSGGTITVSIKQEPDKTTIKVIDTGKGVPEENKPKLFQRFWQAGSTGRYYASTGLGLYLCRRIVEGHHGRIWCDSTLGKGSTFSFELPNKPQE
ncbi:MAG: PAS domain-containing protein [Cyanobacteria bacterium SZAS LIN-3]|nr:PAS domain-containing protein [Cyanobacteria bacterium SZAS LIN-3]